MKEQDEISQQAALLADEPTRQELAHAEAQLAELPPATPLSDAEIAALMARVVTSVPRPGRRTTSRRLLAACTIAMLLLGAAWVTISLWPSRKNSPALMNYPTGVALASGATAEDPVRLSAIGAVYRRLNYAATFLHDLTTSPATALASQAQSIRLDLLTMFEQRSKRSPATVDDHLLEWIAKVKEEGSPLPLRQQALEHIHYLMAEGLQSIFIVELDSDDARTTQAEYLQLLRELLEH